MDEQKTSERYYLLEDVLWQTPGFEPLRRRRSMPELHLLAGLVWAREKGRGKCPIVCSRKKSDYSFYCYRDRAIHLIHGHRSIGGLLHEIAHALGPHDKLFHGPAFRKRCFHLYKMYGDWSGEID